MAVYIELENLPKPDIKKEIETSLNQSLSLILGKPLAIVKLSGVKHLTIE